MPDSLPERPDLDQLRRQAKELRDAARQADAEALERFANHHPSVRQDSISLAAAQLVIARELGFSSWPRLKAAIDADAASRGAIPAFVAASIEGRWHQAGEILRADPGIARRSLLAAAVLGDVGAVAEKLAVDPEAAVAIDEDRGWPALLYACYSRWHLVDPRRALRLAQVVRMLLDAGASPNTNDGGRLVYRSALRGSVESNNPEVTEVLLDAGANPTPGQPIVEAIGHRDHRCLELLLARGAPVAGTGAIGAAVYNDDAVAVSMLLDALEASGGVKAEQATEALPDAAANASLPVVAALLEAGADPQARDAESGSALRLAVRAGRDDTAARLKDLGADDEGTDIDRFIGACLNNDRRAARRLLAEHPDLIDRFTDEDRAVICDAAGTRPAEPVALMLELGFSPHAVRVGEQPIHAAAYHGNAGVVRVLLDAGAEVDARDARFDSTPLAFATVGSGERVGKPGDWTSTVQMLMDAGASRENVWVPEKPPSEEIRDLLARYGIAPPDPAGSPEHDADAEIDEIDEPASTRTIGTGVTADIARHLEAAYRDLDLDLLGSLLHPEVHWTQLCTDSSQVLDWYRRLLAEETMPTVLGVEVDRDAVVLELSVSRRAEGARPAPPQHVYQVFTIDGAQIVDIRGYPDRQSVLARTGQGRDRT